MKCSILITITFLITSMHIFGMEEKSGLLVLPNELVISIIHNEKSLEDAVKIALSLSVTCKYFNTTLSTNVISNSCKHYDITEKNNVMKKLLWSMNDKMYWHQRRGTFILVYAGADNAVCEDYPLLRRAIHQTDKEMIAALFENNADPNQNNDEESDWFAIKDVDILNMFIARDVNLHGEGSDDPNVLWYTILQNPLSEWIKLYLSYKVDAKKRKTQTDDCILHRLVHGAWTRSKKSIDDYVRIGELLLNVAPELINMKNKDGYTALGLARKELVDNVYMFDNRQQTIVALINLFEKHVDKAAQQLT